MSQPTDAAPPVRKLPKAQPRGLWVLFITEMWERFSFYGMKAILLYYLVEKTVGDKPGFGWDDATGGMLYGWYSGLVYLTPIAGGLLADKLLGTHRSMLIGGWIIAAGHGCLALTEVFGHPSVSAITLNTAPAQFVSFMTGLVLIIIGTGFFKPCVSVMVGQLYAEDDPRRDSGFTIFYMGINIGAALATIVAGWLAAKVGWHWGFGAAGVGMVLGLITYQVFRPYYLKGIGLPPHHEPEHAKDHEPTPEQIRQAEIDEHERTRPLTRIDWNRMTVIIVLGVLGIAFWFAFEQAGSSLSLFAKYRTDRVVAGFEIPAAWYQSVNPIAIILFAPLFAWFWILLERRGTPLSTPHKYAVGLVLLAIGYIAMIIGAFDAGNPRLVSLNDVPATVAETIERQADADLQSEEARLRIEMIRWQDAPFFIVQWQQGENHAEAVEILANEDGEVFRTRIERPAKHVDEEESDEKDELKRGHIGFAELPSAVQTMLANEKHDGEIVSTNGAVYGKAQAFVAVCDLGQNKIQVMVDDDGNLIERLTLGFEKVGRAGPHWLVIVFLLATWGELCLSPVGLSMVTKLSPARYTSLMMGLYFAMNFVANTLAGYAVKYSEQIASMETIFGGLADFFVFLFVIPLVAGIIVLLLAPRLKRMMHGLH